MKSNLKILRVHNQKYVQAQIVPLSYKHSQEIDLIWKPCFKNCFHCEKKCLCWDKNFKLSDYLSQDIYREFYALESNSITQGIAIFIPERRSVLEPDQNLLHINLLSTAPWNRSCINNPPRYKGIGTTLFTFAVMRSMELGYEGRVGLRSVKQAEKFYERLNLVNLGHDSEFPQYNRFELPINEAELIVLNSLLTGHLLK